MDDNLEWLTQKTEDGKVIKGTLISQQTVNVIELQGVKKVAKMFYRCYFGRLLCYWFHFLILEGGLHDILVDCMIISVFIPRCYKDVYVKSFFPRTARLWNALPVECFPLTYDLSGFKSRINRHLLTVGSV